MSTTDKAILERRALFLSIAGMGIMALAGVGFAIVSHSDAILLDGVFSSIGLVLSILTYKVAQLVKRPDDEHFNYGYNHFVPQLNMVKALLMIVLCVFALGSAINTVLTGGTDIELGLAVAYALIATTSCVVVAVILQRVATRTGSVLVAVDRQSWIVDALISGAVLISFVAGYLIDGTSLERYLLYLDPLVVTLLVIIAVPVPAQIFRASLRETFLMAPQEEGADVRERVAGALANEAVVDHRVRIVKFGNVLNVLVHAQLDGDHAFRSATDLDAIRNRVKQALDELGFLVYLDLVFVGDMRLAE